MVNATQSTDYQIYHQHYANLLSRLAQRMELARSRDDRHLLSLLEQEQRQLETEWSIQRAIAPRQNGLKALWSRFKAALDNSSKLHVERLTGSGDATWWYAYDPCSGKALYAETESDVVKWIEDNRLGR